MLRDEKWWDKCLKTAKFRHTHNLKFPDYRATGTIRLNPVSQLPQGLFSSSKIDSRNFGYSQNSRDINTSIFLCSHFEWQGETTSLADALSDAGHPLWPIVLKLGCTVKLKASAQKALSKISVETVSTSLYPNYLPQLRLPYESNRYLSLTPITSHRVQVAIHQTLNHFPSIKCIHRCSRATSVGNVATASKSKIYQIRTLPRLRGKQHNLSARHDSWLNKERFNALIELKDESNWLVTPITRRKIREQYKNILYDMLKEWIDSRGFGRVDTIKSLSEKFNSDLSQLSQGHRVAYQPSLIHHIETILTSLINQPIHTSCTNTETFYLVIPNLHVCHANAESSAYTVGMPSLMGLYGFLHAFERRITSLYSIKLGAVSFAVCLHHFHLQKRGVTKEHVAYPRRQVKSPGIVDGWQCDFQFSLIIKLDNQITLSKETIVTTLPKRLCGGKVHIKIKDIPEIQQQSTFYDAVNAIKQSNGQWLCKVNNRNPPDTVEQLIQDCKYPSTSILTCAGYHLLEAPKKRSGSLDNNLHAFCEPILTAIQIAPYKTLNHHTNFFWAYTWTQNGPMISSVEE